MSTGKIILILAGLAAVLLVYTRYAKNRDAALIAQTKQAEQAVVAQAGHDFTLMHFLTGG
jgi:hypothetical protein